MLTHRGTMATVVAAATILVRTFETLSLIFLSAFIFTELFQSLFYAMHEFKEFFIRKSIHKDIVLLFIITVIINARKNSYSHRIIRGSYFMHCIPYVELNIINIDVSFCISETWWHRHLSRRHTYIVSSTRSFIRKVTRGTLNTRTTRSVFVDKVHEFSIITLNVMPTKKLHFVKTCLWNLSWILPLVLLCVERSQNRVFPRRREVIVGWY